jgi:hypothetical protein
MVDLEMTWKILSPLNAAMLSIAAGSLVPSCRMPGGDLPSGELEIRRAQAPDDTELFPTPHALNVPADSAALNDGARFLAGMSPLGGQDGFASLRGTSQWKNHAARMDALWRGFTARHGEPVAAWTRAEIGDLRSANSVFYPFSGPDYLFAYLFYPNAETYLMCGLEPCEPLPKWSSLGPEMVAEGCDGLYASLDTVLQYSYFITKEMRTDLQATRFRGVLPVFLVFLARTGHIVESVDAVRLDGNGVPVLIPAAGSTPGLQIRFRGRGGPKRIFYFTQNLANDSCKPGGPFLRFAASLGRPAAMAKSASYLMHGDQFSNVRDFILTNCRGIAQDPSGVPYRNFVERGWKLSFYGNYLGTSDPFEEYPQVDLIRAYLENGRTVKPIPFGIGYLTDPRTTCLMVGRP